MELIKDTIDFKALMAAENRRTFSEEAEQYVLGALLLDNDAIDRISDLKAEHFYRAEHRAIFDEITRQIASGKTCDVVSLLDPLADKVHDCLPYLNALANTTPSTANIKRHAETVVDRALKRSLSALCREVEETVKTSQEEAAALVDHVAGRIDALMQKRTQNAPIRLSESLADYADVIADRMAGKVKPISTGFRDLDTRLDGGLERGTLTVLAARPGMGKTAMGLALCRNVAGWGSAGFLSMEMDARQVNDRNVAALGRLPIAWLRKPNELDSENWNRFTMACMKANELEFYIDDQTGLNMLEIRNKARQIKRRIGLDLLVIDQLSFITGGASKDKKTYELIGEYTRGLVALSKQMNIAVLLLAQLNRDCDRRPNKRPQLSDLAMSGSIEQDAANVIFLYRDEIYNPDTMDKGICEVITAKQRQGEPGTVALTYIGNQTRFEDLAHPWKPPIEREQPRSRRGFD